MNYDYIDTHSHLNLSHFDADRDEVARLCAEKGVATITIGTNLDDSRLAVELAEEYENLYAIVGLHPTEVGSESFQMQEFGSLLDHQKVVGIGECGLDYFRCASDAQQKQEQVFRLQLDLALTHDLPVMLHIRPSAGSMDAYYDVLGILQEYKNKHGEKLRGQAHFFAGTPDIAEQFLSLGFYISFTGVITFTHDYDEVIRMIPIDRILSETDAPFVAPVPYRGQRAEPWHVIEVVQRIAEIKEMKLEEIKNHLAENARRLWDLR